VTSDLTTQIKSMQRVFDDSGAAKAIRELENSSFLNAIENSPIRRLARSLESSSISSIAKQLHNSSPLAALDRFENFSSVNALRSIQFPSISNLPSLSESLARTVFDTGGITRLQNSAFYDNLKFLQSSPTISLIKELNDSVAFRNFGPLTLSQAFQKVSQDIYPSGDVISEETLNTIENGIEEQILNAPISPLSAEFFLSLVFALILFLLSQDIAEESQDELLNRITAVPLTGKKAAWFIPDLIQ